MRAAALDRSDRESDLAALDMREVGIIACGRSEREG